MFNKKAQVSEGITWMVATITIIVILLFSLFLTSAIVSNNREVTINSLSNNIPQKSFLSYLLTKEKDMKVYDEINKEGKIGNSNGNLALKIFDSLYKNDYLEIWIGVSEVGRGILGSSLNGVENEFFGKKPKLSGSGAFGVVVYKDSDSSAILLKNGNYTEAIFVK